MNISLGIHVGHDRGACIIRDGVLLGAISQERIDRVKHSSSAAIPFAAIDALLEYHHLQIAQISCIGLSSSGIEIEGEKILELYEEEFYQHYQCDHIVFYLVNHHDSHAYGAYYCSGFGKSLIFVADGGGDYTGTKQEAESLYVASGGALKRVERRLQSPPIRRLGDTMNYLLPHMPTVVQEAEISIGRKYEQFTHLLGFGWGQAGKTMGLSAYGHSLTDIRQYQICDLNFSLKYADLLDCVFAQKSLSGQTYHKFLQKEKANIARTVQDFTEYALLSLIRSFVQKYQCSTLCLAGGLFLNCITNEKILEECDVKSLFVMPAAGDDGQAIGNAFYAYNKHFGAAQRFHIDLPYLGLSYTDVEIHQVLHDKNLPFQEYPDKELAELISDYIADNQIVALHRGRTEIGPRALCHRSILANPANPNMKDILNSRVKHREAFRPFAPTVAAEDQFTYFSLRGPSEYMVLAPLVKKEYQKKLCSITHVDQTARVQAVTREKEPFIHDLLLCLKEKIGVSALLNTSFNDNGQPIVETPLDAVNTFLGTEIDVLVLGNCVVTKREVNIGKNLDS